VAEIEGTSRIYCNLCKVNTRHVLIASKDYDRRTDEEFDDQGEWGVYRFWACAGCDTCTMEHYYTAEYMVSDDDDELHESIYHPKRAVSSRPIKLFVNLPDKLNVLYSEVIKSNNDGSHLLCATGLRSLLEGVCASQGITGANLEGKIDGMKALLPESIVRNLHEFRFMGNKAVHELEAPTGFELNVALDVIEDILNFFYALDYKASLLARIRAAQGEASQPTSPATVAPDPSQQDT